MPTKLPALPLTGLALSASLLALGCRGAGEFLGNLMRERPPAALDSMSVASDVRIDSLGYVVGSFVGEGTSHAVHLLSSDTALVAGLARRYRPDLMQSGEVWQRLAHERTITLAPAGRRRTAGGVPKIDRAIVGSPLGQTSVTPNTILLHGSRCGWRGAQVEIVVDRKPGDRGAPLRGPVLASFTRATSGDAAKTNPEFRHRQPLAPPAPELIEDLVRRTSMAMDSVLDASFRSLALRRADAMDLEVNTLADIDAADVASYRARPNTVRFAVSLRERRVTAGRDTLLAATVMTWDSVGTWRQFVFRPTVLSLRRGGLAPYGALRRSVFWRRLQPISDFGFDRDNLWMEQVDVRGGGVLWGIIQPAGNVVVAAAEVEGPCR